jgi:hypothetical protein
VVYSKDIPRVHEYGKSTCLKKGLERKPESSEPEPLRDMAPDKLMRLLVTPALRSV